MDIPSIYASCCICWFACLMCDIHWIILFLLFVCVIGVTFDVKPPFSLAWAGSFLLFVEGSLLLVAAVLRYGYLRGLGAGFYIIVLSYAVEVLGANTGFLFGVYHYPWKLRSGETFRVR